MAVALVVSNFVEMGHTNVKRSSRSRKPLTNVSIWLYRNGKSDSSGLLGASQDATLIELNLGSWKCNYQLFFPFSSFHVQVLSFRDATMLLKWFTSDEERTFSVLIDKLVLTLLTSQDSRQKIDPGSGLVHIVLSFHEYRANSENRWVI